MCIYMSYLSSPIKYFAAKLHRRSSSCQKKLNNDFSEKSSQNLKSEEIPKSISMKKYPGILGFSWQNEFNH